MDYFKIHHLNLGTVCPYGGHHLIGADCLVCHCLLIESNQGLILVDTGLGSLDIKNANKRLGLLFNKLVRPILSQSETAVYKVEQMGFKKEDVQHIILTHLDIDHSGGISDFPHAKIHLHQNELLEARNHTKLFSYKRYKNFNPNHNYQTYQVFGETWNGFDAVYPLQEFADNIALIPLTGHSKGHSGVAVKDITGKWILHAGDSYFHHSEITNSPKVPIGLLGFETLAQQSRRTRLQNLKRITELNQTTSKEIEIFCSHDSHELERMQSK